MRTLEFRQGQGIFFDRNIIDLQLWKLLQQCQHGKAVQTGSKTGLANGQVIRSGTSVDKSVAVEEHVTRFGKAILKAEITILEIRGMKHPVTELCPGGWQIVGGTDMW